MSLTVRFQNGNTIVYNSANHVVYGTTSWNLYSEKGGRWIAAIQPSAGAIVEAVPPCNIFSPSDLTGAIRQVNSALENNRTKKLLQGFNSHTNTMTKGGKWKSTQ